MRWILAAVLAVAVAGTAAHPERSQAAHPCIAAIDPQLSLVGVARAGRPATFRSKAPTLDRIDWGDGTRPGTRRTRADGTIRHTYRRAGLYRIVVGQSFSQCCDAAHENCTPGGERRFRFSVRVRRPIR